MKDDNWASSRDDWRPGKPRRGGDFGENDEFAEVAENAETTRRIRRAFDASRASLPADFFESRLKKAIDESPVWARFEQNGAAASVAVRPGVFRENRAKSRRGRRALWLGAESAAAVALVAAFLVGSNENGATDGDPRGGVLAKIERNGAPLLETEKAADESAPIAQNGVVRIPLNEGERAVAVPRRSEDDFWATFPVAQGDLRTFGAEFTRFCLKRDIKIDKFDGDAEFLLKNVTPKDGIEIAAWFRAKAEKSAIRTENADLDEKAPGWRASKAVESWLEEAKIGKVAQARDVRVSFVAPRNAENAVEIDEIDKR